LKKIKDINALMKSAFNKARGFFRGLKHRYYILAAVVLLLGAGGFVLAFSGNPGWEGAHYGHISVYFFNPSEGRLDAELRPAPQENAESFWAWVNTALAHLISGPTEHSLSRVGPDIELSDLVLDIDFYDGTLITTFSEYYREMAPLEEALFRSAFTLTMAVLPFIDSVILRTYGCDESGGIELVESVASIANSPVISPALLILESFSLFFVDESGEGLVEEVYNAGEVDRHIRSRVLLERLIQGPETPGLSSSIPTETQVRDVRIDPHSLGIYVNLSSDFHARFSGTTAQARMMIASITSTMTENALRGGTWRVYFLIESERREDFHGVTDFHTAFTFDETAMLGFGVTEEYYEGD